MANATLLSKNGNAMAIANNKPPNVGPINWLLISSVDWIRALARVK